MLRDISSRLSAAALALSGCVPGSVPSSNGTDQVTLPFLATVTDVSIVRETSTTWRINGKLTNTGSESFCFGEDDSGGILDNVAEKRTGLTVVMDEGVLEDAGPFTDADMSIDPGRATPPKSLASGESVTVAWRRSAIGDYVLIDWKKGYVEPELPYLGSFVRLEATIFPCRYKFAGDAIRDRQVVSVRSDALFHRSYPLE